MERALPAPVQVAQTVRLPGSGETPDPPAGPSALRLPGGGLGGRGEAAVVQLPDVLLQVEVAAEAFAAGGAGEGLLVVVRVHVEGEVVDLVEGLVADGALVLFLSAVRQFVVLVVSCA